MFDAMFEPMFDGCPKAPNRPLTNAINPVDRALEAFI